MRATVLPLLLGMIGCFGGATGGGQVARPGVMPLLSELPGDAEKRDAILDQSATAAGPEHRKGMTKSERKAETMAATAAAIIGSWFSKTQNVTLGGAVMFEESPTPARPPARDDVDRDRPAGDATPDPDRPPLVPWVKLRPADR